jgi:hypothetical protein|tara:strand:- start:27 stop:260 length:234 start_codon:yes stop_codon:yes gene_type:complete
MFLETDLQLVDIFQVVEVVEVEDLLQTPQLMEQVEQAVVEQDKEMVLYQTLQLTLVVEVVQQFFAQLEVKVGLVLLQ